MLGICLAIFNVRFNLKYLAAKKWRDGRKNYGRGKKFQYCAVNFSSPKALKLQLNVLTILIFFFKVIIIWNWLPLKKKLCNYAIIIIKFII